MVTVMRKILIILATAILTTGLLSACVEQSAINGAATGRAVNADDLLVVDCLLPGQVRQLGSRLSYVTARRPIQTSVHDCQIRGGEYVAYDRADYGSALAVWQPLANQGDPDAQNKIGEIYERGIAGEPDYALAAAWYGKAAKQGHARAQINLGFLYEKGLGVDKDSKAALSWYRKASQMPDAVMIDRAAFEAQQAQIETLKTDLDRSRADLEKARNEQRRRERRLQQEHDRLQKSLRNDAGAGMSEQERRKLAASQKEIEKQRIALVQRQERIRELESRSRRQQENLLLLQTEGSSQREQLNLVRKQLERTQSDLKQYQELAANNERLLDSTRSNLAALSKEKDQSAYQRIQQLAGQLNERERAVGVQQRKVAKLQEKIDELTHLLGQAQSGNNNKLSSLQSTLDQARKELATANSTSQQRAAELEQARSELEAQKAKSGEGSERLASLQQQLQGREQALGEQKEMVQRLRKESDQLRQKLAQLEQAQSTAKPNVAQADGTAARPSIQLIDPPLLAVRSAETNRIMVKRGLKRRAVVGRVMAPAGLYALTVNGARTKHDAQGMFETDVLLESNETPVNVVAIDAQGQRSALTFSLVSQGAEKPVVAKRTNPLQGVDIGRYHALIIGNQDYETLPDLDTAIGDAEAVSKVLREKFGYEVTLLRNADRYQVLSALNQLRKKLTEKDNLLVYYAGHGELDRVNLRGHWLPVDAEAQNTANWISNVAITDILNAMSVRHVLLIADSCYSGALTRSALSQIESGQSDEARSHWLKTLSKMRSRTAMTSGGLAPVLDGGGGGHSVFAKSLLTVLRNLTDVTEGQRVYRQVSAQVAFEATRFEVEQVPEYAPIKYAGHEAGDFLFVPKTYL